jgi:hypothetical protein
MVVYMGQHRGYRSRSTPLRDWDMQDNIISMRGQIDLECESRSVHPPRKC